VHANVSEKPAASIYRTAGRGTEKLFLGKVLISETRKQTAWSQIKEN